MIVTGVDTETTGVEQENGDRIIEICFRAYDFDQTTGDSKLVDSYVQRIHPQRSITPKAQEIHGISIHDLAGCPVWDDVADKVVHMLEASDLLVAHNMDFDGPFIALELLRIGKDVPEVESFCTMKEARWATPYGKLPNLGELCFALNVDYNPTKAHGAEYDVDVMMKCFFEGRRLGFYKIK